MRIPAVAILAHLTCVERRDVVLALPGAVRLSDGEHVWAVIRCDATDPKRFGDECLDSNLDSILKFSPEGKVVASSGGGMFIWPHGIDIDRDGNVWVTDAVAPDRTPKGKRGHQVVKFSPAGKVLVTYPWGDPRQTAGNGAEFVAVDRAGNLYGGEPRPRRCRSTSGSGERWQGQRSFGRPWLIVVGEATCGSRLCCSSRRVR